MQINNQRKIMVDIGCGNQQQKCPGCIRIDINSDYKPDYLHDCNDGLPMFENNSVDFVNTDNGLEHFVNPYYVLQECYRVLKSGGEMRVVIPNVQYLPILIVSPFVDILSFWNWYMRLPWKKERGVHYWLFTKHLILLIVKNVGFEVVECKGRLYSKEIKLRLMK